MQSTIYAQFRRGDRIYRRLQEKIGPSGEGLFRTHNSSDTTSTRALSSTPQRTPGARCHGKHRFQVATTKEYPEKDLDLVAFFDCLHDRADPPERQRTFDNR
jgi:hypothetical protein